MIQVRVERPTTTIGASIHLDRDSTPEMLSNMLAHSGVADTTVCASRSVVQHVKYTQRLLELMLSQGPSSHRPPFQPIRPSSDPSSSDYVAR
jgi:hypothetical protein